MKKAVKFLVRYKFSSINGILGHVLYVWWLEQAYKAMGLQHVVAVRILKDIFFIFEFYLKIRKIKRGKWMDKL